MVTTLSGGWRCNECGFVMKGSEWMDQELGYGTFGMFSGKVYACPRCGKKNTTCPSSLVIIDSTRS